MFIDPVRKTGLHQMADAYYIGKTDEFLTNFYYGRAHYNPLGFTE
jgi:hypothetical protein